MNRESLAPEASALPIEPYPVLVDLGRIGLPPHPCHGRVLPLNYRPRYYVLCRYVPNLRNRSPMPGTPPSHRTTRPNIASTIARPTVAPKAENNPIKKLLKRFLTVMLLNSFNLYKSSRNLLKFSLYLIDFFRKIWVHIFVIVILVFLSIPVVSYLMATSNIIRPFLEFCQLGF